MSRKSSVVDLRSNRLLLDPSFAGYKLSLDPISTIRKQIPSSVNVIQPGDEQYSYSHVKIFSLHNHLHTNPYKANSVYFIGNNLKVYKVLLSSSTQEIAVNDVFEIPNLNKQKPGLYNVSIAFPSIDHVLISDGAGAVYLAKITEHDDEIWVDSKKLFQKEVGFILSEAKLEIINEKRELHILLLHVEEKPEKEKENVKTGLFYTVLTWKVFIDTENNWVEDSERILHIDGSVDYAAIEPGCTSIYVISDKLPKWISDSKNPIKVEEESAETKPIKKIYSWTQTQGDITFWLPLPEDTRKEDLEVSINNVMMEIKVKGENIISNNFYHRIDNDLVSWTFEKGQLEIQLTKQEEGLMWKTLLSDDERGEEILDPELVKSVHERLAHLCSDKEEGAQPSFNSQQLEECDEVTHETALVRIHGEGHSITHEASLSSSPWLFKVSCDATQSPAICCRHDVDACVWQFKKVEDEKTWPHEHIGTFSAFGYVQASKAQKKFVSCPSNLSYVAICEASHHIYIYRQPSLLTSELKNRQTGKRVETISKQQLVNLEAREHILGVCAADNLLCILLENSICVLVVNE